MNNGIDVVKDRYEFGQNYFNQELLVGLVALSLGTVKENYQSHPDCPARMKERQLSDSVSVKR